MSTEVKVKFRPLLEPLDHVRLTLLLVIGIALVLLLVTWDAFAEDDAADRMGDALQHPRWDWARTEAWSWLPGL